MTFHKKLVLVLLMACFPTAILASTADQLRIAAEEGKVAFVLVTAPGAVGVEQAKEIIHGAMKQVEKSLIAELDRSDEANAALVAKYGLSGAPVPLILVFASNGAIAGGNLSSKLTSQQLTEMIPSPKKAEVLQVLQSGHAVLLTASRDGMNSKSDVKACCAAACSQMTNKCQAVEINMDDKAEADFLKQLKVNSLSAEPVTVVINAQGQVTGSFNGPVDVGSLVQAANKKVSSGCCPPGSGKTCPPPATKKGP